MTRRRLLVALAAFLTTALVFLGVQSAVAYWSTSAAVTGTASAGTVDPAAVSPGQLGVTPGPGTAATVGLSTSSDLQTSDIQASGTIQNANYFCTSVAITSTTGGAVAWSFTIDTKLPPYNGTAITAASLQRNGATTGTIVSVSNGVYTIAGAGDAVQNGFNTVTHNPETVNDTPVRPGQTATVVFCLDVATAPIVYDTGAGTYSVGAPRIASCNDPALPGSASAGWCLYTTVTGTYPHFYIGYRFDFDWAAVVANTPGLPAATQTSLTQAALALETTTSSSGSGVSTPTVRHTGTAYSVSSTGVSAGPGGITDGQTITLKFRANA